LVAGPWIVPKCAEAGNAPTRHRNRTVGFRLGNPI
jgi:hypothetical protein